MLVFPQWRPELPSGGCRVQRWMSAERFAPYIARPFLPPLPTQVEDEDSSGSSSPERNCDTNSLEGGVCEWRGCNMRFVSVSRLSAHIARAHAHAHTDGLFYCGWKGCARPLRGFNARYKMLVHIRTHTNERPHTCNQCNKSFSRAENLKIHLRSHSGEKPYVCPYEGCGKAYSNSSDRFKHTRTHTVDKPYCCKVPGCNKRYTDPSSLRKHVKTYKHFTTEETGKKESSDGTQSPEIDITDRENGSAFHSVESISHQHIAYSPPRTIPSPTIQPYNPSYNPLNETPRKPTYPHLDQITYMRPIQHVYPLRIPSHEMSYIEYTQMYEHTYRNYYSSTLNYPLLRPTVIEKVYAYEDSPRIVEDVIMQDDDSNKEPVKSYSVDDLPLNLICAKRSDRHPIEELVKRTDLPLDLSTKS